MPLSVAVFVALADDVRREFLPDRDILEGVGVVGKSILVLRRVQRVGRQHEIRRLERMLNDQLDLIGGQGGGVAERKSFVRRSGERIVIIFDMELRLGLLVRDLGQAAVRIRFFPRFARAVTVRLNRACRANALAFGDKETQFEETRLVDLRGHATLVLDEHAGLVVFGPNRNVHTGNAKRFFSTDRRGDAEE